MNKEEKKEKREIQKHKRDMAELQTNIVLIVFVLISIFVCGLTWAIVANFNTLLCGC